MAEPYKPQPGDWVQSASLANTRAGHHLVIAVGEKALFLRSEESGQENAFRPDHWVQARRYKERWWIVFKNGQMTRAQVSTFSDIETFVSALQEVIDDKIVDYTIHVHPNGTTEMSPR